MLSALTLQILRNFANLHKNCNSRNQKHENCFITNDSTCRNPPTELIVTLGTMDFVAAGENARVFHQRCVLYHDKCISDEAVLRPCRQCADCCDFVQTVLRMTISAVTAVTGTVTPPRLRTIKPTVWRKRQHPTDSSNRITPKSIIFTTQERKWR